MVWTTPVNPQIGLLGNSIFTFLQSSLDYMLCFVSPVFFLSELVAHCLFKTHRKDEWFAESRNCPTCKGEHMSSPFGSLSVCVCVCVVFWFCS